MRRILFSLAVVVLASAAVISGTGAFFSDTETSTGNTFAAGDIDLKIDNESYYNGVLSTTTTWTLADLTVEKFFNFLDLKPDDYGEDTISIHVDTNDAYLCANVTLTSNNDNTQNEPEAAVDVNGLAEGELADLVNFIWWADDGDNVLETGEGVISQGPIGALELNEPHRVTLADSVTNIWTGQGGPIPGAQTRYIGKAWCFGAIAAAPLTQDNASTTRSPALDNNADQTAGTPEDGGFTCDGSALGNESQTDSLTADVQFEAMQARNNPGFLCEECELTNENVLFDGSFETPEVTNGAQWDIFPSPVGGWQVAWRSDIPATFGPQNRPAIANLEFHEGVLGAADQGDQYVELDTDWAGPNGSGDGEPASVTIYQDIATTPGATYQWSYAFSPRPNTPGSDNRVEMRWGGVVEDDTGNVAGGGAISWSTRTGSVVATTTTTRIAFTDLGTANSLGSFVDDFSLVKISCVPLVDNR